MNIRTFYCVIMLMLSASCGAQSLNASSALAFFKSAVSQQTVLNSVFLAEGTLSKRNVNWAYNKQTTAILDFAVPTEVIPHGL